MLHYFFKMEKRQKDLAELQSFIDGVDTEITMILQSLQWDRKQLLEGPVLVPCAYECGHRVPPDKKTAHEQECFLRREGYATDDLFLPEILDNNAPTAVKFSREDITQIIERAAAADPSFQRGRGVPPYPALTAARLTATLTADERRAVHDAVVDAAPGPDYADDFVLPGTSGAGDGKPRAKSKLQVLAELRDMRRRRTRYRTHAPHTHNYSHVLRDVIKTQMELFADVKIKDEPDDSSYNKPVSDAREQFPYKQISDDTADTRGKYANKYNMERQDRSKTKDDRKSDYSYKEDKKYYDNYKEKHRNTDNRNEYDRREKYFRKESKDQFTEKNGRSSSRSKDKRERDEAKRHEEKYSKHTRRDKDRSSVALSDRSYRSDKCRDGASSSGTTTYRHRDYDDRNAHSEKYSKVSDSSETRIDRADKYEQYNEGSSSKKRHRDHYDDDNYNSKVRKHSTDNNTKRDGEFSYDKKHKRHS